MTSPGWAETAREGAMQAHEAYQRMIGRDTGRIAEMAGPSRSMLEKMKSGRRRTDAERLLDQIQAAQEAGRDFWSSVAPVIWILRELSLRPRLDVPPAVHGNGHASLSDLSQSVGTLAALLALALEDDRIDESERNLLRPAIYNALSALYGVEGQVEAA